MAKNTKRRTKTQLERDRRRISDMYLRGMLQSEIAAELGLSQATISTDLKALQGEWLQSALLDFNEIKARELARIDKLEREYWTAWERSLEDAETIREENGAGGIKDVRITKGQSGNPTFLSGIQWCIEQRLKIFGIYEATKLRIEDWQSDIVELLRTGRLSPEDVKAAYPDLAAEFFARAGVDASKIDDATNN